MVEYIDRKKLINRLLNAEESYKADHDYEVDDGILSAMLSVNQIVGTEPTADVIERSKIDKAIEEIKALAPKPTAEDVVDGNPLKDAVWETLIEVEKIIKRNTGE